MCGRGQHGVQVLDCLGEEASAQSSRPAPHAAESSSRWKGGKQTVGGMDRG